MMALVSRLLVLGNVTNGIRLVSQATGYGTVIGLSVLFAIIILAATRAQKRYLAEDSGKSEMFMVANRSVGTGLTASAMFSSWMWINETVFSAVMGYNYGIAAPFWFATGCAFQISLMAVLGVLAKLRVPFAHTSLEIVQQRYGPYGHVVFAILNLINNVFGCASMILAGSQLIVGISGMHIAAATVLLPFGVVLYTAVGGLKATFITDYLHTTIALILIIYFTLSVLTSDAVGGVYGLYDKIVAAEAAGDIYIKGNYKGSLLTFKSRGAIIWGVIHCIGNLALMTMDTAFWQKSFACQVNSTVPGYNIAAVAIFAVPWALGTVFGLTARVIQNTPIFPTYPGTFTAAQVGAGYVEPYTLYAILGSGGAIGMLLCLFMAVTSTVSSSSIAVSSIFSYDLYRTYINKNATDSQVVRVSHFGVVFHGVFITGVALALSYGGANMTWLNYMQPILTSGAVFPTFFTLMWSGQTRLAAIISPVLGLATGVTIWLTTTKSMYGSLTLATTANQLPALYGALGSLFSPIIYSLVISYARPKTFDWREFLKVKVLKDIDSNTNSGSMTPTPNIDSDDEKAIQIAVVPDPLRETSLDELEHPFDAQTIRDLKKWLKIAWGFLAFVMSVTIVVWPLPLYRDYVFTKTFYAGWIVVSIFWQFLALVAVVIYPVWDGRHAISTTFRGVLGSVTNRKSISNDE